MARELRNRSRYREVMIRLRAIERRLKYDEKLGRTWFARLVRDVTQVKTTTQKLRVGVIVGAILSFITMVTSLIGNWHTVTGWWIGPVPKWDGTVTLGLGGDSPRLTYQFTLQFENKGDALGGPGGIAILGTPSGGAKPPFLVYDVIQSADEFSLRRSIAAGGGVALSALPPQLLACVWSNEHPNSVFPVFLALSAQDAMLTQLSGIFPSSMVGYVRWAILPKPPSSGNLTGTDFCATAHLEAKVKPPTQVGVFRTIPVAPRPIPSLARPPTVIYEPGNFGNLATWNVRFSFAIDTPEQFFDDQSEVSVDGEKTWYAAGERPERLGRSQLLQLHGVAEVKSLSVRYTGPISGRISQPLDFAAAAIASLKERLLSNGDWLRCHSYLIGECDYVALAIGYPALQAIHYGGDNTVAKTLQIHVSDNVLNGDYKGQACANGLKPLTIDPAWNEVFLQLEFTDGKRTEIRPFALPESKYSKLNSAPNTDACHFVYTKGFHDPE